MDTLINELRLGLPDSVEAIRIILRMLVAGLLGGLLGFEREQTRKAAGLRTHMVVAIGACLCTIVGAYGFEGSTGDPSRVASNVVTGIGFLGAGAIIRHGINVRGLTTAASLWVVAAIGVSVGAGMYVLAIATTALVLLALWPLSQVKRLLEGKSDESRRLGVTLAKDASVASALATIEESGFAMESVEVGEEEDLRRLDVVIKTAAEASVGILLDDLGALEGVRSATVAE